MADAFTHGQMVLSIMSYTSTERNREKECLRIVWSHLKTSNRHTNHCRRGP
jgi:hypothetical protein